MEQATVALVQGQDRYESVSIALREIAGQVTLDTARCILVKPNFVSVDRQLAATHVDAVRAVLDFVRARYDGPVVVAEGAALAPTREGFRNYGYEPLVGEYGVELVDLNADDTVPVQVYSRRLRPLTVRLARTAAEADYRISVGPPKAHDVVLATLSIKNLILGAILKYDGKSDKPKTHQGPKGINYVLYALSQSSWADLALIDGFEGMEGNGPVSGTGVPSRVAVAGTDPAAVDRIGCDLMGIDPDDVGYLTYLGQTGPGRIDRSKIEVRGGSPEKLARKYRLNDNIEYQMTWKT